jgi:hypothetical protein
MPVSTNPEDFSVGGARFDDAIATVVSAKWETFDYEDKNGVKKAPDSTVLKVVYQPDDPDMEKFDERYRTTGQHFIPNPDGKFLNCRQGSEGKELTRSCQAGAYLRALRKAGFTAFADLNDDVNSLSGVRGRLKRIETGAANPNTKEKSVALCFVSIEGQATAAPAVDVTIAQKALLAAIEAEGEIPEHKVKMAVVTRLMQDATLTNEQRQALAKVAATQEFLDDGPWTVEGGVVKA